MTVRYFKRFADLTEDYMDVILPQIKEFSLWLVTGVWFEVVLKISGMIGVIALLRAFYFTCCEEDVGFLRLLSGFLFFSAILAFVLSLIVGLLLFFLG